MATTDVMIEAEGLRKRFGDTQALDGVDLAARRAPCSACSGPTAPARPPPCASWPRCSPPTAAPPGSAATTSTREPTRCAELIGLTGQYASVDEELTGEQNLVLIGQLLDLGRPQARLRAGELLEWFDLTDAGRPAGQDLLRRHAPPARPRGQPGRPPVGDLPGRADDRASTRPSARTCGTSCARSCDDGSTVLLTTQYLEEADALADEITVIDHGRVIAHDTPEGLKQVVGGQTLGGPPGRPGPARRRRPDPGRGRPAARPSSTDRGGQRRRCDDDHVLGRRPSRRLRRRRHRASPSCPCTCPASTRSSSPSPATAPPTRRTQHDRPHRRRDTSGAASCADGSREPRRPALLRLGTPRAGQAQPDQDLPHPEALLDVTLQPMIFLALFTYIFGGAIARRLAARLPAVPAARHGRRRLIAVRRRRIGVNLNTDIEKGVFDRFRSCRSPARRR